MSEYIVDLSKVEKSSYSFKTLFYESIPLGKKIVRCRDCANYLHREHLGRSYCHGEYATEPDGFCAWAVRRDG